MAASSPAPPSSNKSSDSPMAAATPNGSATPQRSISLDPPAPKPTLRGINKPKCIQCGNVARSRCPFQCCKSCCSKAQNPCHIHVLKQNGTLPDKPPPTTTTLSEQPSADLPSTGASWRLSSLRQLSTTFANSLRAKKPLSRKDAININKWRFAKLKEHIEGNIQAENEAFDRYMQNVRLLEETFSVLEGPKPDDPTTSEAPSEERIQKLVSEIKVKLKSNDEQADNFRQRIRDLIDEKLRKLQEEELVDDAGSPCADELDAHKDLKRVKVGKFRAERTATVNDLIDKLSKARSEDDLVSCLEMKLQLFKQIEGKRIDMFRDVNGGNLLVAKCESGTMPASSPHSLLKMFNVVHINQGSFSNINEEFSSLDQIAEL